LPPEPIELASTKFIAPRVPAAMVERPRLLSQLDRGAESAVTLVAAPAGAGKTALLSAWAGACDERSVAWFSLEPADGERRRFLRGLLEAIRRAGVGDPLASVAVHPSESVDLIWPAIVNGLEGLEQPLVVVLDDLHEIRESPVLADLDRLLRQPPPNLRLVVSTRTDPPLRLSRLRVAGALQELREADLAFRLEEAGHLFRASGVELERTLVEQLWRRTEGWAAGLRLAALTLRTHPQPERFVADFAGDDSTVADYLLAEVLAQQPPELRDFLLRISVVDRVSGGLADALTGRNDSERILARLEREHALLSSTGGARAWHRLHPLFSELLRSELRYEAPQEVGALHRRAACWFAEHSRPSEALWHAAAAEDWEMVGELAGEQWVPLLLRGELDSFQAVFAQLPEERAAADPELALAMAGAAVDRGDEAAAGRWMRVARDGRDAVIAERRQDFDLAMATVGLLRSRLRGDTGAALAHARDLLAPDDGTDPRAVGDDHLRALALSNLGIAELWAGDVESARRDLSEARAAATSAGLDWVTTICLAYLSVEALFSGRLGRAERLVGEAEALAGRRGWFRTFPVGICAGVRSSIALERNRIDDAERWFQRTEDLLRASPDPPLRMSVELQRARLLAVRGDAEAGLEALLDSVEAVRGWPMLPSMLGAAAALEATLRASLGELVAAERTLAPLATGSDGTAESAVGLADLRLKLGEPDEALETIAPHLQTPSGPFEMTQVDLWVIAALAHDALADHDAAGAAIERALDGAEPSTLRRPFVAQGTAIVPVLRRQLRRGTGHRALVEDLLTSIQHPAGGRAPSMLAEPLSEREAAVLRFLPTMMSNQEIASELFLSVNTVKTHLKAIYRKLDVVDRRAAVSRARELSLLGPP
jgi:LuxR family maltose regulon positive regulatory protein